MSLPIVAIIGSPNVGKSTIFNRFIGKRQSIVDDLPGVTRDRLYYDANWLNRNFKLVDTGGIEITNSPFQEQIRYQAEIAIEEADVILFIADGNKGVTNDDRLVARILSKQNKPIVLAVNKIDNIDLVNNIYEFYELGLGEPLAISAAHGIGVGDVLDKIVSLLPEKENEDYSNAITFSFIGRPNVGKSSLFNAVLNENRSIVSNLEGTTRDTIDTAFLHGDDRYVAIDTAGLKKRGKIYEAIDKYAMLRALSAINRSEIALLVLDASSGIVEQDKHIAGLAYAEKKGIVIVVNKWDLRKDLNLTKDSFKKEIQKQFLFISYAPIIFVSALTKEGLNNIFSALKMVHQAYQKHISTSLLNKVINEAQEINPAPNFNGGRLNIYYVNEVKVMPPTFVFFVNNPKFVHFSYQRYLENSLRDSFELDGTPIDIIFRQRL